MRVWTVGAGVALVTLALAGLGLAGLAAPVAGQTPNPALITAETMSDGAPLSGVTIDLFDQTATGGRGSWLGSAVTDSAGRATFDGVVGQCYTLTAIAPPAYDFGAEGRYANRPVCADDANPAPASFTLRPIPRGAIVAKVDRSGSSVDGVNIDLFTMTADGTRGTYLQTLATGHDGLPGEAQFNVAPGCYMITFIAPGDQVFVSTGSPWRTVGSCVTDNSVVIASTLTGGGNTTFGGSVLKGLDPVPGLQVDLFAADDTGNRVSWRSTGTTDNDGRVVFDVEPGCWTLTFIAPPGDQFSDTHSGFTNRWRCLSSGETFSFGPVALMSNDLSIGGQVMFADGPPVGGVTVDLFSAAADGTRGQWLAQTQTDPSGLYGFQTSWACVVLTFIAPDGTRFTANGGGWWNAPLCPQGGQTELTQDAEIEPIGPPDLTGPVPLGPRQVVSSWTVDGLMGRWEGGIYDPPLLSLDGATVAFTTGAYGVDHGLRTRRVDSGDEVVVVDGVYSVDPLDITGQGSSVLFRQRATAADDEQVLWSTDRGLIEVPSDLGAPLNLARSGANVAGLVIDHRTATAEARLFAEDGQTTTYPLPGIVVDGYSHVFSDDNRYLVQARGGEESTSYLDRIEIATGTVTTITGQYSPIQVATDVDQVRLDRQVGWVRFSTGEATVVDHGADSTWFTYRQDFDLSPDGSTFVYPRSDWRASVYRPATGEVRRLPLQGNEDFAAMSDHGTRFLIGEPLTDSTYRLVVLSMPPGG